ncbi:uncharacterized protein LOC114469599 [Gouania willdenowi]|uniref:uncharacterized protein LOC114469599 n=1 Tax=Gouania willdenowi TaxID=441366 RepID=UPI00105587FC|nr:uncharacterized protein LOC114469599 [Gouania willdenowi]
MSIQFSGWEVVDDGGSNPGVVLQPTQSPQNRGVYKMYHGTTIANARLIVANGFKPSSGGLLGKGVYVSRDKKKASAYPRNFLFGVNKSDQVILELRVRVGRVKKIDSNNYHMRETWHRDGYDTAWVPPNCGLSAVPSGLEEDCVFDPKRVKVVGIASTPNSNIQTELEKLLAQRSKSSKGGAGGAAGAVCALCKRKTQHGSAHIQQQCWKCGTTICILMAKHFCP